MSHLQMLPIWANLKSRKVVEKLTLNYIPNNKMLDLFELKTFADDKSNVADIMISLFHGVENIAGKGENAGSQHFLLFPQCFQKPLSITLKVEIVCNGLTLSQTIPRYLPICSTSL